jgi:hypothetical protein
VSDLALTAPPPRAELVRQLEGCLDELIPGARLVAQRLLGAESRIDLVALEPTGRVALVMVGEDGEDLELVGRGLAQRAWVRERLGDWIQLAPELGVRPEADVKVWLVCPSIRPEVRAAVTQLGPDAFGMAVYHCVRNGATTETLVEALGGMPAPRQAAAPPARPVDPIEVPVFRTGLTDADLGLTPDERHEFDSFPPGSDAFRSR